MVDDARGADCNAAAALLPAVAKRTPFRRLSPAPLMVELTPDELLAVLCRVLDRQPAASGPAELAIEVICPLRGAELPIKLQSPPTGPEAPPTMSLFAPIGLRDPLPARRLHVQPPTELAAPSTDEPQSPPTGRKASPITLLSPPMELPSPPTGLPAPALGLRAP